MALPIEMKRFYQSLLLLPLIQVSAAYGRPLSPGFDLERLGYQFQEGADTLIWEAQFLLAHGDRGVGLLSEGERTDTFTEGHELKLFYSHHTEDQREWQIGFSSDVKAEHEQRWLFGLTSFALPAAMELESALFISNGNHSALELKLTRGIAISNQWFFHPEVNLMSYGRSDEESSTGAGLSTIEVELRLGYDLHPNLSLFVSTIWEKSYGKTADYLSADGEKLEHSSIVSGITLKF